MSILVSQQVLRRACRRSAAGHVAPLAWALLATAFLVVATLAGPGPSLSDWLGDPDDAMRLVSVRELLAGAPWFDTTLPRIGAPEPLVSHWSRLIDAPLAAMIGALSPLLGRDGAELATRFVWPVLLFFALALIVAREAHAPCAGPLAAAFALILVTTSATALAQFRPGRIDHHNVQILCAVAGLLLPRPQLGRRARRLDGRCPARPGPRHRLRGAGAGRTGAGAWPRWPAIWQPAARPWHGPGCRRRHAALLAALVLTVPPARWLDVRCDALSLNLCVLAACATAGLWAAMSGGTGRGVRLAILGASVVGAAAPSMPSWSPPASPARSAKSMPRCDRYGSTM